MMKTCPYCAEEIQDEAILCHFCGKEFNRTTSHPKAISSKQLLTPPPPNIPPAYPKTHKKKTLNIFSIVILSTLLLFIFITAVIFFASPYIETFLSEYSLPTETRYHNSSPTSTKRLSLPTKYQPDCIYWENLRPSDVGEYKCVFGRIAKINYPSEGKYYQIIHFSIEAGSFLIWGEEYFFSDVQVGDCVYMGGIVKRDATSYFFNIYSTSKIYNYLGCP